MNQKINYVRTWSSRKAKFLSKITSSFPVKFEYANHILPIQSISYTFYDPEKKIMGGNYVFCCSSRISFNRASHIELLKCNQF